MKKGAALAVTKAKKPYKEGADAPGPGFASFGKAGRIMFRLPGISHYVTVRPLFLL